MPRLRRSSIQRPQSPTSKRSPGLPSRPSRVNTDRRRPGWAEIHPQKFCERYRFLDRPWVWVSLAIPRRTRPADKGTLGRRDICGPGVGHCEAKKPDATAAQNEVQDLCVKPQGGELSLPGRRPFVRGDPPVEVAGAVARGLAHVEDPLVVTEPHVDATGEGGPAPRDQVNRQYSFSPTVSTTGDPCSSRSTRISISLTMASIWRKSHAAGWLNLG